MPLHQVVLNVDELLLYSCPWLSLLNQAAMASLINQKKKKSQVLRNLCFLLSEWSEEGFEESTHFTQCLMSLHHNETVSFEMMEEDILPS